MNAHEETNGSTRGMNILPNSQEESIRASAGKALGRRGTRLLDTYIDAISVGDALDLARAWTSQSRGRYICFCNVHSLVTATVRSDLAEILNDADLVLPDGSPVAWTLRLMGFRGQKRVSGPDFMWEYCALAQQQKTSVFLYGNRDATLEKLISVMCDEFPDLQVAGAHSPPFRSLSAEEDDAVIRMINASGANVVFVSLGCPKQEIWMASHRHRINAVMLGLGAAFDYHAGCLRRAPPWMQQAGLEWLHRLVHEPRRLWKRYLIANSIFMWRAVAQVADRFSQHGWHARMRGKTISRERFEHEGADVSGTRAKDLTAGETR